MSSADRRAKRWWAVGAGCALGLLVLEVGLRALGIPDQTLKFPGGERGLPRMFEPDARLFWRLSPAVDANRPNARGLRGHFPAERKRPGELRIACVGDSSAFGFAVRYEDAFGVQLERLLRARLPDRLVTSVLVAMVGYSSHQNRLQLDALAPELEPDWTVLYSGAWNDWVPARGSSDAAHSARVSRVAELVEDALAPPHPPWEEYERVLAEEGRYIDGPRVPPDDFRANLEAMVARARATGRAVLVIPPLPEETLERYAPAREYRAVARAVAAERDVPLVEGDALFAEFLAGVPEPFRTDETGRSILFADPVHPSALGHAVLARALERVIGAEERAHERAPWTLAATALRPLAVAWDGSVELKVTGAGFAGADGPVLRAWLGDTWLERVETRGDGELVVGTRFPLPRGAAELALVTPRGTLATGLLVDVRGPTLEVERRADALVARVRGAPGEAAGLWWSHELAPAPAPTAEGDFLLPAGAGRPDGRADLPLRYDLVHPHAVGAIGPDGAFAAELPLADLAGDALWLQGAVRRGARATLSEPLRVELGGER